MRRSAAVIRIEPRPGAGVAVRCAGVMLLAASPVPFLPLPWWGAVLLGIAWIAICAREYRIHLCRCHRLSVSRLVLEPGGDCLLDFAQGPRAQRATITARLITPAWVLLRLHAPRRKVTLLLNRAQLPAPVWRGLQIRLRWQRGGARVASPGG